MKAYVITTGTIFGLLTLAHLARMVLETGRFAREPEYWLITSIAAALCVWAARVYSQMRRTSPSGPSR
jgi:hypothetical protein